MTTESKFGPSILDNPVGFIDRIAELNGRQLSEQDQEKVLEWILEEYTRIDDLISTHSFVLSIRPYNRLPRGLLRSFQYSDSIFLSEPFLGKSYGRSQIDLQVGREFLRHSSEEKGHWIRASFRAGLEDRRALSSVYLMDSFVDVDDEGETVVKQRKFEITFQPTINLRQMGERDMF